MRWEELNGDDFAASVKAAGGVCVVVLGSVETHAAHLPLGTDMINGLHVAEQAAKIEPAVVFPPLFIGQVNEARCFAGTLAFSPALTVSLLMEALDEIGRNGFTKIILHVAHGGNRSLAHYLAQCQLHAQKPYQVYVCPYDGGMTPDERKRFDVVVDDISGGHADELETSLMLSHRPDLVDMSRIKPKAGRNQRRLAHLPGMNPLWWYGQHPDHYAGRAEPSTAEKGRVLCQLMAEAMARFIKKIKEDRVAENLSAEFFAREAAIREKKAGTQRRRGRRERRK